MHSGTVSGISNATWPRFDSDKFADAQLSFLEFGHAVFSKCSPITDAFYHLTDILDRRYVPGPVVSSVPELNTNSTATPPAPRTFSMVQFAPEPLDLSTGTPTDHANLVMPIPPIPTTPGLATAHATVEFTSPGSSPSIRTSVSAPASGGAIATVSVTVPELQVTAQAGSLAQPGTPQTADASAGTQTPSQPTGLPVKLPGSGPGQVNGMFDDDAGIDCDRDEWFETLKRLWPVICADLGPEWDMCLARYIDYERHHGFEVRAFYIN